MSVATTLRITDEQRRQYQEEGYFILERGLPDEYVQTLRQECQRFIDKMHAEMDAAGTDTLGINHRNKRYFVAHPSKESAAIREILFSEVFAEICRATIGPEAYVYWEQYVVKAAEVGMKFGWHQDSAFGQAAPHKPYVSCWCALEDMSDENGTVYVLPYSRAGTRDLVPHFKEESTNDLIGYNGDDPGVMVEVPAGGIAVFSSHTLHRSGVNTTDRMRRVYLAQYSPELVQLRDGTGIFGRGEPFLKDGERVV
jgi:ectoine hydroxylase-related dioxygenase (phytanoyl-CoA dioxygenase family)